MNNYTSIKNYYKRILKLYFRLLATKQISFQSVDSIVFDFSSRIVHIGITDQLKGLISAFYFSKLRNCDFFVKDDKNNSLTKMGLNTKFLLNNKVDLINPLKDSVYLNYNHKYKIKKDIIKLTNQAGRIFWFSNNNILEVSIPGNWKYDWHLLFNELFNLQMLPQVQYNVGVHVRTAGFFGDFSDSYMNVGNSAYSNKLTLISKISDYLKSLNLPKNKIYFCSDSIILCNSLSEFATVNPNWAVDGSISHSTNGNIQDLDNLIYDWNNLVVSKEIISLVNENFYNGVFPLHCSLIKMVNFKKVEI